MSTLLKKYEEILKFSREKFLNGDAVVTILDKELEPKKLEIFLIYFCILGVPMTKHVERWIRTAGVKAENLGFEIGKQLQSHANQEADHHKMLIDDAHRLVPHFNELYNQDLSIESLFKTPLTKAIKSYINLHESTIESSTPFNQIAIEYEIELISTTLGPSIVNQVKSITGEDVFSKLSFIPDHVEIDVAHTKFNRYQLEKFLDSFPETLNGLVDTGRLAIEYYAGFFNDCLDKSLEQLKEQEIEVGSLSVFMHS